MSARIEAFMHRLLQGLVLLVVALISMGAGVRFSKTITGDPVWPYAVRQTIVYTPDVPPGGIFRYARSIDYFNPDCTLYYDRMLLSLTPDEKGAIRRAKLDSLEFKKPPSFIDDKLQSQDIAIPADFPCGPAMLVDSPFAYCTRYQRLFNDPMRRNDAVTKFNVVCRSADKAP